METLVILAVVVWVLFKLVQKVTSKLYPPDSVKVQEKPDTTPATDAWGNYPKAEGHVVLFEQYRHEQALRQQAAKEADTFYRSREWRRLRYQAFQRYGNKEMRLRGNNKDRLAAMCNSPGIKMFVTNK